MANSTNGSLTAQSATFGKVRGSRDDARSARRRIRGRTHAPSRTRAVCIYRMPHASSTGQFELTNLWLYSPWAVFASIGKALQGCIRRW